MCLSAYLRRLTHFGEQQVDTKRRIFVVKAVFQECDLHRDRITINLSECICSDRLIAELESSQKRVRATARWGGVKSGLGSSRAHIGGLGFRSRLGEHVCVCLGGTNLISWQKGTCGGCSQEQARCTGAKCLVLGYSWVPRRKESGRYSKNR